MTLLAFALSLSSLPATTARAAPLEQLPADTIGKLAAAASEAMKARPVGQGGATYDLAVDRALGYKLGEETMVIVPDRALIASRPPSGSLVPVAVIVTRDMSVGDFRKMVAMNQALPLTAPGERQNLALWMVSLKSRENGRTLEILGAGNGAVISMPARTVRGSGMTPITLRATTERFLELTFTIGASVTSMIRLGPAAPGDSAPQPGPAEDTGSPRRNESSRFSRRLGG